VGHERGYRISVTRNAPNYIWRKTATAGWLEKHEPQLTTETGGAHALVERPGGSRIGIEFFCRTLPQAQALEQKFGGVVVQLPADWEARFFAAHKTKPLRLGRRLTIQSDCGPQADHSTLVIPAGAAFGTGEHATTAMSLRLLERVSRLPPGWRMLDAGTGSGILALAGKRLGAGEVIAIDNDPTAIRTAKENARRNRLRGVKFVVGEIQDHIEGTFDIIAANLYSDLIATVLPCFRRSLRTNGRLILSGVLRLQEAEVERALRENTFRISETRRRGKWIALLCLRAHGEERKSGLTPTRPKSNFPGTLSGPSVFPASTRLILSDRARILCRPKNFPTSSSRPIRCANRAPAASSRV